MIIPSAFRSKIHRAVRSPAFWLLLEAGAVIVVAWLLGMFSLGATADTPDYIEASRKGLTDQLLGFRTLGYPLFLRAASMLTPELGVVPFLQFALHFLVAFFLHFSLVRFGARPWEALAIATGYMTTVVTDPTVQCIMSDSLGRTLAVGVMASLLWIAAEPRRPLPWAAFALLLVAAYQVRPANLVLVGLCPVLFLVLRPLAATHHSERAARRVALALRVALVAILPLLAFCLFRLLAVGEFGLVSFGGFNAIGSAAELLSTERGRAAVPQDLVPLAREIIQARASAGIKDAVTSEGADFKVWRENYNFNIWKAALPAARALYGSNGIVINGKMGRLSQALLGTAKALYGRFLLANLMDGFGGLLRFGLALQLWGLLAVSLFLIRLVVFPQPGAATSIPQPVNTPPGPSPALQAIAAMSLLLALSNVLLVALTVVNVGRHSTAAGILLPSLLAYWVFREGREIIRGLSPGASKEIVAS